MSDELPPISEYVRHIEMARLYGRGRFARYQRQFQSMSLRGRQAWAQILQHCDALTKMFSDADRRRTEAQLRADVARAKTTPPEFTKAMNELNTMYQRLPKRLKAVARPVVEERKPRAAETAAKCFDALAHNRNLNAAQRGELMLGLSRAANLFSKSHQQNLAKVEKALALLRHARAAGIGADADKWIAALQETIRRGEVEPNDLLVIEDHLGEIRDRLREHLMQKEQSKDVR